MSVLDQVTPVGSATPTASNYDPTPSNSGLGTFGDIMDGLSGAAEEIGGVSLDIGGNLAELLQTQMELQMQMEAINLVSNIEKSRHEGKMSVIRNIRVS